MRRLIAAALIFISVHAPAQELINVLRSRVTASLPTLTLVHDTSVSLTCSSATCPSVTIPSTAAGNLVAVFMFGVVTASTTATNLSALSASCPGGWVFPSSQQVYTAGTAAGSMAYCLAIGASQTSIVATLTAASIQAGDFDVREYHSTGTGWLLGTFATPTTPTCTSPCTGPSITLTGTNSLVIAAAIPSHSITAVAAPFSNFDIGPGEASGFADHFPTTSGTGATFTHSASGQVGLYTLEFYDNI